MRHQEKSFNAYERKRANIPYMKRISKNKNICNTMEGWTKNMDAESRWPIDANMLNAVEEKEMK